MSAISGQADITVRAAMDIQQVIRKLEDMEKHVRGKSTQMASGFDGFGKSVDKAFKFAAGGFIGSRVFGEIEKSIEAAAKANERYGATFDLIRDSASEARVAVGSVLFEAYTALGDWISGGAITEQQNARVRERLSLQEMERTMRILRERMELEDRYVKTLKDENDLKTALLNTDEDQADVVRLRNKLYLDRRELERKLGKQSPEIRGGILERFDRAGQEAMRLAERERELKAFRASSKEWEDAWRENIEKTNELRDQQAKADEALAAAGITNLRVAGRSSSADAARTLVEAYKSASDVMLMARLPLATRQATAGDVIAAAERQARQELIGRGPGAVGSATVGAVGQAGVGAVFGSGAELAALTRDVRSGFDDVVRALGPIGVKLDELKRAVSGGVPAVFR